MRSILVPINMAGITDLRSRLNVVVCEEVYGESRVFIKCQMLLSGGNQIHTLKKLISGGPHRFNFNFLDGLERPRC
jgi:hypothetical protein